MVKYFVSQIICVVLGAVSVMFFMAQDKVGFDSPVLAMPAEVVEMPKEPVPAKGKCDNPECVCDPCLCDPCECNMSTKTTHPENVSPKSQNVDTSPIIYYFTMPEEICPGCRVMSPIYEQLKAEGHDTRKLDITKDKFAKYVKFYGVSSVPQFITVDPKGKEIRRTRPGVVSKATILGESQSVLEKVTTLQAAPVMQTRQVQVYKPQRSGWFRARSSNPRSLQVLRSVRACGPGGCR